MISSLRILSELFYYLLDNNFKKVVTLLLSANVIWIDTKAIIITLLSMAEEEKNLQSASDKAQSKRLLAKARELRERSNATAEKLSELMAKSEEFTLKKSKTDGEASDATD